MSTHSENSSRHHTSTFLLALLLILAAMLLMGQSAVAPADDAADGKEVFERVCATCHTIQPPPGLAPPMAMIVRHYRMAFEDSAAVKDALVSWVDAPDSSKSILPAHAIERFGLMAPVALSPEEIDAVTDYIMTLEPNMGGGMMGRTAGGGKMMQHGAGGNGMMGRGMMRMDSTAAMTCMRMDSSATAMTRPRTGTAPAMTCPRADSTAAAPDCKRMEGGARGSCRMGN